MSQDKAALVAELQELTQELEQMGNMFNANGIIDAQEQEMLDLMQNEISELREEIAVVESSEVVQMIRTAPTTETSGPTVTVGMSEGDENSNISTNVTLSEEGVSVDTQITEGNQQVNAHLDSEGNFGVSGRQENEDGSAVTAEISNKFVSVGFEKKWEIEPLEKELEFPVFSGLDAFINFKLEAGFSLEANSQWDVQEALVKAGVKGVGTATGTISIGGEAVKLVRVYGSLAIIPSLEASGYLCYDINADDFYPELSGLIGNLDAQGSINLSASDEIMDLYDAFGGEKDDLIYEIWKSDKINLIKLSGPSYGKDGLQGNWNIEPGDAINAIKDKINEYAEEIQEIKEMVEAGVEFVTETLDAVKDEVVEFGEDCIDYIAGETMGAVISASPAMQAALEEHKRELARDSTYQSILLNATNRLARKKEHMLALSKMNSLMDRIMYLLRFVREEVKNDEFIKSSLEALKNDDDDTLDNNDRISSTDIKIKDFIIEGDRTTDGFIAGKQIGGAIIFEAENQDVFRSIFGRREFIETEVTFIVLCDGNEVASDTRETKFPIEGYGETRYSLNLPEYQNGFEHKNWEVKATINFVGEVFDVSESKTISVIRDPYLPPEVDSSAIILENLAFNPQSDLVIGTQVAIEVNFNLSRSLNDGEAIEFISILEYTGEESGEIGSGGNYFPELQEGANTITLTLDIAEITREEEVLDPDKFKLNLRVNSSSLINDQYLSEQVSVIQP